MLCTAVVCKSAIAISWLCAAVDCEPDDDTHVLFGLRRRRVILTGHQLCNVQTRN